MTRRHRRHYRHKGYSDFREETRRCHRTIRSRKRSGWGMNLYRNTREGKVAGVAAGLADHWDVAHWVVRLLWVGAFLFTGTLALWVYLGAWLLLAPRPDRRFGEGAAFADDPSDDPELEMEYDERYQHYRPRKVFQYSEPSSERLQRARDRLDAALKRVEDMESYVTSRQYELNREFSRL
ncbi:PspC domain-containing protein [Parahaliea maris]|uniref:PspC domain-containing protein n=1 Tax=Parahaliea maris TaxID=2716870 RepID=A0A5C8ZWL4_9GAMM|nr:PspC domain-containing protein [Parahaliea maris]TXS92846.1 PspC domain-containing protein [Parahaliea maris]